jgi:hypothetical protein
MSLIIKALLLSAAFCANAWGKVIIDEKMLETREFNGDGYKLYAADAPIVTEQELKSMLAEWVAILGKERPNETITIHVRTAIDSELDKTKDVYVSFGDCYMSNEGLVVSSMKCTEMSKYKYVAVWANPKGILNEVKTYARIPVDAEKSVVSVVNKQVMKTELSTAVLKDQRLMNLMREMNPNQQCNTLKKYGYVPQFSAEDKNFISQCLHLN